MTSQVPAVESQESLDQEREMDSYVATLRDGYLGIGSGLASPIEMEIQTEEEIDIVKPVTFDPMHSGLVNLSPLQLADLKVLAAKRDDEQPMTNKENEELDYLLE